MMFAHVLSFSFLIKTAAQPAPFPLQLLSSCFGLLLKLGPSCLGGGGLDSGGGVGVGAILALTCPDQFIPHPV